MEIDLDIDLDPNRPLDLVFYFDLYRYLRARGAAAWVVGAAAVIAPCPIWQSRAVRHASPARPLRSTLAPCLRRWCSTWRPQSLLCAPQQHAQREHPRACFAMC